MPRAAKVNFPVQNIRRFLEPGPIVLVSSRYKDETNIMTMGWHMMMGFSPSLVACYIWDANHSHDLIRKSKQCVINVPTVDLAKKVVAIGNCSGRSVDKFEQFKLTAAKAEKIDAPLIDECYASFECKLYDASQINKHGLFIFECVKAHARRSPKFPKTIHYRGDGLFMLAGATTARYRSGFKPSML